MPQDDVLVTELDIAKSMISGELSSPQVFNNVTLFDLRITGTGAAYRVGLEEFVHRHPDNYLNDEFLERCNGLPVLWNHPEEGVMDSKDFSNRIIGTIFKPYIKDDEVWGIAKIYDDLSVKQMTENQLSTSPGVLFNRQSENTVVELSDGKHLLIEGVAPLIDHLAICERGVWDKLGEPSGVRLDSQIIEGVDKMTDEVKADADNGNKDNTGEDYPRHKNDADPTALNAIMDAIGKIGSRMDALNARMDAADEKVKADAEPKPEVKADAEPKPEVKADAEEDETESAAMADAQARADSVLQLHGKHAPRPMSGEKAHAYRNRVLKPLQQFSERFKNVDFSKITDNVAFKHFEDQVYNDAQLAANDPRRIISTLPRGQLREVTKKQGRVEMTEFIGDISGFTNQFRQPSFKGKISEGEK